MKRTLLTLALLALTACVAHAQTGTAVTGVLPANPAVEAGGSPVTITLHGTNLEKLTDAVVVLNGAPVPALTATLLEVSGKQVTRREVTLSADARARSGSSYLLQVAEGPALPRIDATIVKVTTLAPVLIALTLSATSIFEGRASTGTVALDRPALSGGAMVQLASSDASVELQASTVVIPAGQTSASFDLNVLAVPSSNNMVTISAIYEGGHQEATLTVIPLAVLTTLTLSATSASEGETVTGTVVLDRSPLPEGATIRLTSSDASVVPASPSVFVAWGQTSASFDLNILAVPSSRVVTISATHEGVTREATLEVNRRPVLTSLTLSGTTLIYLNQPAALEGEAVTGTVTLDRPAPSAGAKVLLASNKPDVRPAVASVVVPAGQTSASFNVITSPRTEAGNPNISATYSGETREVSLVVSPTTSLASIHITGPDAVQENSRGTQFGLLGTLASGASLSLFQHEAWTTNSPAAEIDEHGFLTARDVDHDTPIIITATYTPTGMTMTKTVLVENMFGPVQLTVPPLRARGLRFVPGVQVTVPQLRASGLRESSDSSP